MLQRHTIQHVKKPLKDGGSHSSSASSARRLSAQAACMPPCPPQHFHSPQSPISCGWHAGRSGDGAATSTRRLQRMRSCGTCRGTPKGLRDAVEALARHHELRTAVGGHVERKVEHLWVLAARESLDVAHANGPHLSDGFAIETAVRSPCFSPKSAQPAGAGERSS